MVLLVYCGPSCVGNLGRNKDAATGAEMCLQRHERRRHDAHHLHDRTAEPMIFSREHYAEFQAQ